MLSVQHMMCTLLANGGNMDDFRQSAAYVILPDAIRGVGIDRAITHFEESSKGNKSDISWFRFPVDIKSMSKEDILNHVKTNAYLSPERIMAVVGENSHIERFYACNQHLPKTMFTGIENHMKQDIIFDAKIREWMDFSEKEKDVYRFNDEQMDGKGCRAKIAEIEQYCIEVAASKLYQDYGITFNQDFVANEIVPVIERDYPDCIHNCVNFMNINPDVNERITNHDVSYLDKGPIPREWVETMFDEVCEWMNDGENHYVHDTRVAQAVDVCPTVDNTNDKSHQCE